ncbi:MULTISPECIES: hypothetical protein [unclassified Tolypothrix]|uniref:hypothetical protein n=1 Tax=unclassified Tolypothrix TaxID=2649714 RepID=UPI0005EAA73F|nr:MULTISPECIES: hypothetical protein [unclassified Tolypothrix]BAY89830.1 hypothetical protein NIES3275_18330 [Microchaete diplosiphon NIES-3275]EKF00741.1 hypothetical protein FDUTEX481_08548 [Tolypothrix sp. PCC 7601]MBE9082905.1 hypothetical protein [Tolypothrix sp. LEGE 11397]UYD24083.1 hypothetical protein HGR01_21580 [Tolypothrix sp. PCC 7712]UYD33687.1 hypothetical protein HG267_33150 [Tolypothrix sp. PCC 7601]
MSNQTQLTVVPDCPMLGIELDGFYQTPNSMAIKAIRGKLTAADWSLWSYLQMIEPFGDRMVELPRILEIAEAIGVSERQVKRSLAKLEDLELYRWEPVVIRGQNLAGKQAKELRQKKKANQSESKPKFSGERKMTELSGVGQDCPELDSPESKSKPKFSRERKMTELSGVGQNCPNQELEPLYSNGSRSPQISQTYTEFIQTLSEDERANFLEFCEEKTKNLSYPVNDIEAWLAHQNKAGQNRWEVYYKKFLAWQQAKAKKSQSSRSSQMMKKFQQEIEQQHQQAMETYKEKV